MAKIVTGWLLLVGLFPAFAAEPEKFDHSQFPMRFKRVDSGPGIRFDFLAGEDGKEFDQKSMLEKPGIQP